MHTHTHAGRVYTLNVVGLRVHDQGGGTHLRGLHNNINIVCAAVCCGHDKICASDGRGDADGRRTWDVVVVAERDSRRSPPVTVGIFFNIVFYVHVSKLAPAINASLFIFIVCVYFLFLSVQTRFPAAYTT